MAFFGQPRTLLWRLCLALIVVQVLVGAMLAVYAWQTVRSFHHDQTQSQLERLIPFLAASYDRMISDGATQALDERVKRDGGEIGLRISVFHDDGTPIADSHHAPARMDNHLNRPEIVEAQQHPARGGRAIRFSTTVEQEMMVFARRLNDEQGNPYLLRVGIPIADVNDQLMMLARALALALGITLLATIALMYMVARSLSNRVYRLSSNVRTMAQSEDEPTFEKDTIRELLPLQEALESMSRRLRERMMQLQTQQREHHAILQSMNNGVLAIDMQHRIVSTNRMTEDLFNLDPDGVRGRLLQEAIRSPELNRYIADAFEQKDGITTELRLKNQSGTVLQVTSSRMLNPKGQTVGLLVVLNDVTAIRRLESMRSDFAANVSHELRTPITNIKGYVETMIDVGVDDSQQTTRFLEIIKRNSDRLAAIIEDILSLAWLEQPDTKNVLLREKMPIGQIVDSVIGQFENAATAKEIRLEHDIPEDLEVSVNAQLIEQALANFVSNAIKYSPNDTIVRIEAQQLPGSSEVRITVIDQGPGISEAHLQRVFERFYRVDKARSRELGGTGLGLAIVKHIALVHGGRVSVESQLGQGSRFSLILPNVE
ncbi:MAG: sensor histidine kinase [Phycisphaerales bacterium]|nr:MAG: sensor histidine kinase [Phycisphaerales bacterium]